MGRIWNRGISVVRWAGEDAAPERLAVVVASNWGGVAEENEDGER